ncbi:MAG: hypothetical protein WA632_09505 [Gallionella sp.]
MMLANANYPPTWTAQFLIRHPLARGIAATLLFLNSWLESTELFISARKLRNLLVHEYMAEAGLFLEALQTADEASRMLMDDIIARISRHAKTLGLDTPQ